MGLSADLLAKFAKATRDGDKTDKESTLRGTAVVTKNEDGTENKYVIPDGSEGTLVPVSFVSNMQDGDRVLIMIKNHTAVVTGNLTNPSTAMSDIDGILLNISKLNAEKLNANDAKLVYATIENLKATNAEILALETAYGEFTNLTAESFAALNGTIESLGTKYANIDFSNIGTAAMEYFYARSGLIKDVTVGDQTITGHLVGVTISGDLIEGNTIKAEKLVIKGDDGLFYKLNTDGLSLVDEGNVFNKDESYPEENITNVEWHDDYSATVTTNGASELVALYFWLPPGKTYIFSYEGEDCEISMYTEDWAEVFRSADSVITDQIITNAHHCYISPPNTTNLSSFSFRNIRIIEKDVYDKNKLDGSIIAAKSITATKISVSDLVAFGATIGGFHITDNSIYSGAKESIDNTTRGLYFNNDGAFSFGDATNYVIYRQGEDGKWHLNMAVDSLNITGGDIPIGGRNLYLGTRNFDGDRWTNLHEWETWDPDGFGYREYGRYGAWLGLGQYVEVKAGETYTFSFYARGNETAEITIYNSQNHTETTPGSLYIGHIPDEYIRYHFTFTVNEDCIIYPRVENMTDDGWIQIYGLKLERGSVATDWSPAPEDAENGIQEAKDSIGDAGKTATNFISYDADNGLQLGNKTSGAWQGFRTQITATAYNILDAAGAVLASYGSKLIELGKNATDAVIKLCGGKGTISYNDEDDFLQFEADNVRVKGVEMSSVATGYTDSSGVQRNSAVNVEPTQVQITSGINRGSGWESSNIYVGPDGISTLGTITDMDSGFDYEAVQNGSSGIWKYRKWADGKVELWGTYSVSNKPCQAVLGGWYRSDVFTPGSFPFTVYNPHLTANFETGSGTGALLWATTLTTTSSPSSFYIIRPTSSSAVTGKIIMHVTGTWK